MCIIQDPTHQRQFDVILGYELCDEYASTLQELDDESQGSYGKPKI